eukprot:356500-Chlamydomonas_euryale.AAC.10
METGVGARWASRRLWKRGLGYNGQAGGYGNGVWGTMGKQEAMETGVGVRWKRPAARRPQASICSLDPSLTSNSVIATCRGRQPGDRRQASARSIHPSPQTLSLAGAKAGSQATAGKHPPTRSSCRAVGEGQAACGDCSRTTLLANT